MQSSPKYFFPGDTYNYHVFAHTHTYTHPTSLLIAAKNKKQLTPFYNYRPLIFLSFLMRGNGCGPNLSLSEKKGRQQRSVSLSLSSSRSVLGVVCIGSSS